MGRVLLVGGFGQGNLGDEAKLDAFLHALDGSESVVTSSSPADTERLHGCESVATRERASVVRAASAADAVVFAGGTLFKLLHPSTGRPALDLLMKAFGLAGGASALGRSVAMVGVGADALERRGASVLANALVRLAELVVVRDEVSASVLADAGVPGPFRVGADVTWTRLPIAGSQAVREDVVTVVVSHAAAGPDAGDVLVDALAQLVRDGLRIEFQPWQVHPSAPGDLELAHRAAGLIGSCATVVDPPVDLLAARTLFAQRRLVVGMRYHALIAAASAGTPFVSVRGEPKMAAIAGEFDQPVVTFDSPDLGPAVLGALDLPPPRTEVVRGRVEAAEESFRLMRLVLDAGRSSDAAELVGLPLEPSSWLG